MLLKQDYEITILNRGSDYFHSKSEIEPHVNFISCDRFRGLKSHCPGFMKYLAENAHVSSSWYLCSSALHEVVLELYLLFTL